MSGADVTSGGIEGALDRLWVHLGSPGSFFDGAQRLEMARVARAARDGDDDDDERADLPGAVTSAARTVASAAHHISEEWVDRLEADGVSRAAYVEIIGVVSMVVAADTFAFGTGERVRAIPKPTAGEPSGEVAPTATRHGGWVPTVGAAFAHTALSLVPTEHRAKHDLTGALYLATDDIFDMDFRVDGLRRDQMELVAARTSLLNECFF